MTRKYSDSNFTITTVSSSLNQRGSTVGQIPFSLAPFNPKSIRGRSVAHVSSQNQDPQNFVSASAPSEPVVTYLSPVFYLKMEEGTGTSTADSSNSENGYNATLVGTPTWTATSGLSSPPAVFGDYVLDFDGSTDYLTQTPFEFGGACSFSFWTKLDTITGQDFFFMFQDYNNRWVLASTNGADLLWQTRAYASTLTANSALTTGTYLHIVCTVSSGGDLKAWVNGSLVGTLDAGSGGLVPETATRGAHFFGDSSQFAGNRLDGIMDEFSMWDFELSEEQVGALYNGGDGADANSAIEE